MLGARGGASAEAERRIYEELLALLGADLRRRIGQRNGPGAACLSLIGRALVLGHRAEPGPDGTRLVYVRNWPRGTLPPHTGGWTWGSVIALLPEERGNRPLLLHEYVHVLQYRQYGIRYPWRYLRGGLYNWATNPFEVQAVQVEQYYIRYPWLPPLWEMGGAI